MFFLSRFFNLLVVRKYSDDSNLFCHYGSQNYKTSKYQSKSGEIDLGVGVM